MKISNMLQGEKIRLTAVSNDDVAAIVSWYEDTAFSRMFDATPARPKSQDFWLSWLKEQEKKTDNFLFAIRPRNSSALIGYVQLEDILWPNNSSSSEKDKPYNAWKRVEEICSEDNLTDYPFFESLLKFTFDWQKPS